MVKTRTVGRMAYVEDCKSFYVGSIPTPSSNFAVYNTTKYITLKPLVFNEVIVPKGFVFDGVSVPWFAMFLFTHNDLKRGIRASCLHDYMCQNKAMFSRTYATHILTQNWKLDGLGKYWYTSWKPHLVSWFVNLYQKLKGWK